jgi:hypothetical protein
MTDGRPLGSARARAFVALAVSFGMLLAPAAVVRAQEAPYANASTTGDVGCQAQGTDCPRWDATSLRGLDEWDFDESRTSSVGPSSAKAAAKLSYVETDEADGMLAALTINGTISAEVAGVERAEARAQFAADFLTRARTLSVVGSASVESSGTDSIGSGADIHVQLDCGSIDVQLSASGGFEVPDASDGKTISQDVEVLSEGSQGGECSLNVSLVVGGGTDRGASAAQHTKATAEVSLTIEAGAVPSPSPTACALSGIVTDGDATRDSHANPLANIQVALRRDGADVGDPVTTARDGTYCIPEGVADPGDYVLRATLVDRRSTPPLFETRFADESAAAWAERPIHEGDFGSRDLTIAFSATPDRAWLPDVALIHWQAGRFVGWLLDGLGLTPGQFGHLTISTFEGVGTSYSHTEATVYIEADDSPATTRDAPYDDCPENCEWHEISHHVGHQLGIANRCQDFANHGGWTNRTSCDSLTEGFAMALAAFGSMSLDDGSVLGYATAAYGSLLDLESNWWRPWSTEEGADGKILQREDFDVANLLWDLADDTPTESDLEYVKDPARPTSLQIGAKDHIALGAALLVRILASAGTQTVADIADALVASPDLPAPLKVRDPDISDEVASQPITLLDEVFILHGFMPGDATDLAPGPSGYHVGDIVGKTDHFDGFDVVKRRNETWLPGSAVRFVNGGSAATTVRLDVAYPTSHDAVDVVVPPRADVIVQLTVPPYWHEPGAADSGLPPCGQAGEHLVTITLTAAGSPSRAISSCDFLHLVAGTKDPYALTYAVAGASPGSDTTILLGGAVGIAVVALVVIVAWSWRRRRGSAQEH